MIAALEFCVAWAAKRLGYVPASEMARYKSKTQRAARLVNAYRLRSLRGERRADFLSTTLGQTERALRDLRNIEREFHEYRDRNLQDRYGIRTLDRQKHHDGESVTMALRPPAFPL